MIDQKFVKRKISSIQQDLARLEEFKHLTFDQAARDWRNYSIIKNLLMEIIGRGIDINQHLIAELSKAKNGVPLSYTETFLKLAELNVLPEKFAQRIAKSAGFRNAIVHGYNNLDEKTVYHSVREAIKEYSRYCDDILKFLNLHKNT